MGTRRSIRCNRRSRFVAAVMSDESKAESFKALLAFLACVAIIVGLPWWSPIMAQMIGPDTIVVLHLKAEK